MAPLSPKPRQLAACIDSNVFISGIAFGGTPLRVLERALRREFQTITSVVILKEVRRNLVNKLGLESREVDEFLENILNVSSAFVPSGEVSYIDYQPDNLILEIALNGRRGCVGHWRPAALASVESLYGPCD